jgi:hypothetical protein
MTTVREQLRNNAVALTSLLIALSSLGYNTWRNERTEHNRNIRAAGFEMLGKLAEFERVVFLAHYDRDKVSGNPRTGWTYIIVMNDLAQVIPGLAQARAAALRETWRNNWEKLGADDDAAIEQIDRRITDLRETTLETLHSLR